MFKVNNKDTKTTPVLNIIQLALLNWNLIQPNGKIILLSSLLLTFYRLTSFQILERVFMTTFQVHPIPTEL